MKLAYRAYDLSGRVHTDTLDAEDRDDAVSRLRGRGLFVTELAEQGRAAAATGLAERGSGLRRLMVRLGGARLRHLAMFTRQLHVLVATGTPMVDALGALERQAREPRWRAVIADLKLRVEEGAPLSDAMAAHPDWFDTICRSLVAAGESGGNFDQMLERLSTLSRKQLHVRNTVAGALVYPALLLVISGAVLTGMLVFVMPRFAGLFTTLDMPLPASTQAMMAVSTAVRSYWWAMLIGVIAAGAGAGWWLGTPAGRLWMDTRALRIPKLGAVVRSFTTARITRMLGVLVENHVPLLEALELTEEVAGNAHYRALVRRSIESVERGDPVSAAFNDPALVSPSVYEAMRSGEATGQLGPLLLNMSDFLDEENEVVLRSLTSILEPAILVVLGVLVGAVALSMFLPLFDMTAQAGGPR